MQWLTFSQNKLWMMLRQITAALFLFLFSAFAHAQLDTTGFVSFIEKAQNDFDLPSISMAVVKDGKVILSEGFGSKSNEDQSAPDAETMYAIASLSKAFTAASVAMLVEEGKLGWKDPVVKHLPWFKLQDEYVTEHITVEDILCHRSGLLTFDGDLLWYGSNYSRKEAIERLSVRPLTHGFRESFGYQNLMFMTAGELIEVTSGTTWDDFVKTRILEPLEMNRTTSDFEVFSKDKNIAKPNIDGEEIFMLSYNNSGATAALNSCTADMVKWLNFWLDGGIVNGDTLLSEASIRKIWSLHTPLGTGKFDKTNDTNFKGYGLGWFLMDYDGKKIAHHGGGLPGYITKVAVSETDDLAVVILTNDMSSVPSMMMYATLDWANGNDYEKWAPQFLEFKEKGKERQEKDKLERLKGKVKSPKMLPKEDYVGVYEDEMYGEATVMLEDGKLILSLNPAKELFSGYLTPWDDHVYRFDHNDPFLTYGLIRFDVKLDKINAFTIDLPNGDFHFDKLNFVRK